MASQFSACASSMLIPSTPSRSFKSNRNALATQLTIRFRELVGAALASGAAMGRQTGGSGADRQQRSPLAGVRVRLDHPVPHNLVDCPSLGSRSVGGGDARTNAEGVGLRLQLGQRDLALSAPAAATRCNVSGKWAPCACWKARSDGCTVRVQTAVLNRSASVCSVF